MTHALDPAVRGSVLLRRVRLVSLGGARPGAEPVDVRIRDGVVTQVLPALAPEQGEPVLDAGGRWACPGLWDGHVHLGQWALTRQRLDVRGTAGPDDVTGRVAAHVGRLPADDRTGVVLGYGYRSAAWDREPTVAELDAVSGEHPVVLISGDAHNGWLSSRALQLLGQHPRTGPLVEQEWFAVLSRLDRLPTSADPRAAYLAAASDAAAKGVTGIVDVEFEPGPATWPTRVADGIDALRVRTATYPDTLDAVLAAGLRTGDAVPGGRGLVTTGPLKVIFDGSLNTATAYCCEPYRSPGHPGAGTTGRLNLAPDELTALLRRAAGSGLDAAVHAIGDAAVRGALDALRDARAPGSIEHAQLVARADLPRFAALGVVASVQPAHLLDDRDVTARLWPDRQDRCFPLRSLLDAGATLRLGSDAPVAPLDPWLAMAAAVHRSSDGRPPWNPAESLTAREALAASTDGRGTLRPGSRGDVALLDADPLAPHGSTAETAEHLRATSVAATFVGGRPTHLTL
jgi:predicted amidohydrolase YtcJ